jgi:FkbM family methyltransferase
MGELRPQIGQYEWMWRMLRVRAKQTGGFLPQKLHRSLCRFARKPYFIGTTPDGVRYCGKVDDSYAAICATFAHTEDALTRFLIEQTTQREGDYLDIGTNIGIVAATVAKSLPAGRSVLAFEPLPQTARCAAATFALNGLTNVRLFCGAVGQADSELAFYTRPGHSEAATLAPRADITDWQEQRVPVRTLNSLHQEGIVRQVAFLKFDVEGHEPQAIAGAARLIAAQRPGILYEFHPHIAPKLGWTAEQVAAQIAAYAPYRFHTLRGTGNLDSFPPPATELVNIFAQPAHQAENKRRM